MKKFKWMERREQKKNEESEQIHIAPESSFDIIHRVPTVGDTTVAYDYNGILDFYNNTGNYVAQKIESGIKIDEKNAKFLRQDIQVRYLMLKTLQLEIRERHRNARVSINQEKNAAKQRLEYELEELTAKYEELNKEEQEE